MVVLVDGKEVKMCFSTRDFYKECSCLKSRANDLTERTPLEVGKTRTLYVSQGEYAVVRGDDTRVNVVGSDEAATCHIVILHHTKSNGVAVAHFDGVVNIDFYLTRIVGELIHGYEDTNIDVYASGGIYYSRIPAQGNATSQNISLQLIRRMIKLKCNFNIKQWCCCELNTRYSQYIGIYPIVTGLCWDRNENKVYPALFHERGPDRVMRSAFIFINNDIMRNLYTSKENKIIIQPFKNTKKRELEKYKDPTEKTIMGVRLFLNCVLNFLSVLQ